MVNISSIAGITGRSGAAAVFFNDGYSAANRAIQSFTETWAREAAPSIRVNELVLGLIQQQTRGRNSRMDNSLQTGKGVYQWGYSPWAYRLSARSRRHRLFFSSGGNLYYRCKPAHGWWLYPRRQQSATNAGGHPLRETRCNLKNKFHELQRLAGKFLFPTPAWRAFLTSSAMDIEWNLLLRKRHNSSLHPENAKSFPYHLQHQVNREHHIAKPITYRSEESRYALTSATICCFHHFLAMVLT